MASTPPSSPASVTLDSDLLCVVCGYDLRGLDLAAHCPECNATVERSLNGWLLENASSSWLWRVLAGLWLYALATVGWGVLALIGPDLWDNRLDLQVMGMSMEVAVLVAVFLLTARRAGQQARAPGWIARWATRLGTLAYCVIEPLGLSAWLQAAIPALDECICVACMMRCVAQMALFLVLHRLCRAIPNRMLTWACLAGLACAAIPTTAYMAYVIACKVLPWLPEPSRSPVLGFIAEFVMLGWLRLVPATLLPLAVSVALLGPLRRAREQDRTLTKAAEHRLCSRDPSCADN